MGNITVKILLINRGIYSVKTVKTEINPERLQLYPVLGFNSSRHFIRYRKAKLSSMYRMLPLYVNCVRDFLLGFLFNFSENVAGIIRNI
jgi:hypothetical protein